MANIALDDILLVRKNVLEMLSQRGFNIDPSVKYLSKDRLSISYSHFCESKKDRLPTMDIHIENDDSQAYVAWCPEEKSDRYLPKIGKMFRDNYQPGEYDDLIIILVSNNPVTETQYTYESNNVTIFSLINLKINITKHRLVPKHRVLSLNCAEKILKRLQVGRGNLPQIDRFITEDLSCRGDPIARYYGMRVGDIVEITRTQRTSGDHRFYREVVGFLPPNSGKCFSWQGQTTQKTESVEEILTKGLTDIVSESTEPIAPEEKPTMTNSTITLTLGEAGESHAKMQLVGKTGEPGSGFTLQDLENIKQYFTSQKKTVIYKDLSLRLKDVEPIPAAVLIIRNFLDEGATRDLFSELHTFEWDKKFKCPRTGKVKNKRARRNIMIREGESQEADYEKGDSTIIDENSLPILQATKGEIVEDINQATRTEKASDLVVEGNQYYDLKSCGIGYHGDGERRKVIALRLGASMPIKWNWFKNRQYLADQDYQVTLNNGDLYIMSEMAVGTDWNKPSLYTLRHAAGCETYLSLKKKKVYDVKDTGLPPPDPTLDSSKINLGDLSYKGNDINSSYGGYSMGALKSAIQKCIRREEREKAHLIIAEVASFYDLYALAHNLAYQLNNLPMVEGEREDEPELLFEEEQEIIGSQEEIIEENRDFIMRLMTTAEVNEKEKLEQKKLQYNWKQWALEKQKSLASLLRVFVHRLMIISVEDCFDGWLPIRLDPIFRSALSFTPDFSQHLIEATELLLASRKIRVLSDINSAFLLPAKTKLGIDTERKAAYTKLLTDPSSFGLPTGEAQEVREFGQRLESEPDDLSGDKLNNIKAVVSGSDLGFMTLQQQHRDLIFSFLQRLVENNNFAYYWLGQILQPGLTCQKTDTGRGGKSDNCLFLVWRIIETYIGLLLKDPTLFNIVTRQSDLSADFLDYELLQESTTILKSWFSDVNLGKTSHKLWSDEKNLFLYYAILLIIKRDRLSFFNDREYPVMNSDELRQLRENAGPDFTLPGYVYDIHVGKSSTINHKLSEAYYYIQGQDNPEDINNYLAENMEFLKTHSSQPEKFDALVRDPDNPDLKAACLDYLKSEYRNKRHFALVTSQVEREATDFKVPVYRIIYHALKDVYREPDIPEVKTKTKTKPKGKTGDPVKVTGGPVHFESEPDLITDLDETNQDIINFNVDLENFCRYLALNRIPVEKQQAWRRQIGDLLRQRIGKVITLDNFQNEITPEDLQYMFNLYDKFFFSNTLSKLSQQHGCVYTICWDNKCTTNAGLCTVDKKCKQMEITLYNRVFYDSMKNMETKKGSSVINSGLKCDNILECVQITFEHELVHALIDCFCVRYGYTNKGAPSNWTSYSSPATGHSKTFISIVNNTFGHTDYRHDLDSTTEQVEERQAHREEAKAKVKQAKDNFTVGEMVTFQMNGEELSGHIKKKNPARAIVKTEEGSEFSVPYLHLKKKA